MVLDAAIREAVAKLDPAFGYAESFDEASKSYSKLIWAKAPPELMPGTALLVHPDIAREQLKLQQPSVVETAATGEADLLGASAAMGGGTSASKTAQPRRFYGSVEIDMNRPVKSFDAILNAW